jgi:hypothetical protein
MTPAALRKRYSESNLIEFCLQALLSHSTLDNHCAQMVKLNVLAVFDKIVRDHPNNPLIKSLIGRKSNACYFSSVIKTFYFQAKYFLISVSTRRLTSPSSVPGG